MVSSYIALLAHLLTNIILLNRKDKPMRTETELFYEPISILEHLSKAHHAEMSGSQLAFICGLLKQHKPKKIVEIGVAAGGGTAVILNCISLLHLDAEMFSVDLSVEYYRDKRKKTGYMAEEYKQHTEKPPKHKLYVGRYAVECLDEIGDDIDFLILDTVHSLPGELLDFLAYYPFLKERCIIILHDIAINHLSRHDSLEFATKVLFDTVTAEKILNLGTGNILPNIGAFMVTRDTGRNIADVFSALTLTWAYMPEARCLTLYRDLYSEYYTPNELRLFDLAVQMNRQSIEYRRDMRLREFGETCKWIGTIVENLKNRVYIYGCGEFGKKFCHILRYCNIEVGGYIISDGEVKSDCVENIYYLSEVNLEKGKDVILVGVNIPLQEEICVQLQRQGIEEYIVPGSKICDYLSNI